MPYYVYSILDFLNRNKKTHHGQPSANLILCNNISFYR
jgi:hypothetical protein